MPHELDRPFHFDEDAAKEGTQALSESYDVRTICNVIRRIHAIAKNEEVTRLCSEAIWMAKRMDTKLRGYSMDWDKGLWLPEQNT
jgi:vacuolar-type H+-ATPase subunit C/Vma6